MTIPLDKIQAILFDLDGTLVDTDDVAVARLAGRLRPFLKSHAPRFARWFWMQAETPGNALITFLDWLHLDTFVFALREKLHRQPAPLEFHLIEGVMELITAVSSHYPLALVTTRGRRHIQAFLAQYPELAACFQTTIGANDTRRLKPQAAPVLLAAQRLGIPSQNCLMVGDTRMDVLAARRAGAWSIAVLCGFGQRHELERAGAHMVLKETADLAALLQPQ